MHGATRTPDGAASNVDASQSHKARRQSRNKKASDPFLELPDDAVKLLDQPSPNEHGTSHSLLADLVLTPINMIALILSLSVVERQDRGWRLSQDVRGPNTLRTRLTRFTWLDPQPYQDSRDTMWQRSNTSTAGDVRGTSSPRWYTRKKHRAVAKMELSDALELRGRVMVALFVWSLLGLSAIAYAMRRLYAWASA